ncbi:hypothetical protein [uncultured Corynebacterium sp.]|uniref:hypothetical protein n=1 Tax=uncultured Corynebacterium sp. TaxID=159447 RepID=UPI0026005983|nr:hypothetical protein [uncultured Corynebacterium sp.]
MNQPPDPRMNMSRLAEALAQGLEWRRDESDSFYDEGVEKLPRFPVVAVWDDGQFIHFVLHILAGSQKGFLGYCYEDDPERWSWTIDDVYPQEVSVLSDRWFYGENLVRKIYGAVEGEIYWQGPVPDKYLPPNMEDLHSISLGISSWENPDYFPRSC